MTVSFTEYKKVHKTSDQKELEYKEEVLDKALEDMEHFRLQQTMKWSNLPEGTQATPEEAAKIMSMFSMVGQANRDFRKQQRKMGLRPWENDQAEQGKIISFK